jgi:hypothetical protein
MAGKHNVLPSIETKKLVCECYLPSNSSSSLHPVFEERSSEAIKTRGGHPEVDYKKSALYRIKHNIAFKMLTRAGNDK